MPSQNIYLGLPDIMNGIRLCPANSFWTLVDASGNTYNFKDLGLQVIGYTGAGMAPVINQTTPYALIGGSYYQRTVPAPRTLTLLCYIDADNLRGLQLLRKALESYIAPDTATQQAAQIKLRYALTNYCGDVIGTVLEMACNYVSGLEGNVDNLNQERFALQFIEYAPPSIKELATNSVVLDFQDNIGGVGMTRTTAGVWASTGGTAGGATSSVFDSSNNLWYGVANAVYKNGVSSTATNGQVKTLVIDQSGNIYAGGAFTTPQARIMKFNGASWVAVGATLNNTVDGLAFANNGDLYAVGNFTAPNNRAAKWNGSAWSQLTAGANLNLEALCIVKGLGGNMYIGGNFTTADALTVNRIVSYNVTSGAYVSLGSGANASVNCLAVGLDGKVYAGGAFTTMNGLACNRIAVWNGTNWQPLGPGFDNSVNSLFVDSNGTLYAFGQFSAVGDASYRISSGAAKWNGSVWLPLDIDINAGSPLLTTGAVSAVDGKIFIAPIDAAALEAGLNIVTNSGSANAVPTFVFTGPGQLTTLINNTTGKALYFNYLLLAGETATLVLNPVALTFTSSFFGNVISRILPGSDMATFSLKSGVNNLSVLISGTTSGATSATLQYRNTHWHFDAGVA